jgi:hypothetical protein
MTFLMPLITYSGGKYSADCVLTCHSEELCDEESLQILRFAQNDTRFTEYLSQVATPEGKQK